MSEELSAAIPSPPKEIRNRVTIVETVSHQVSGQEAESLTCQSAYEVASDEQSYKRHLRIGETWTPLDLGYLADEAGLIVLQNTEGKGLRVIPTEEQKAATAAKVLELCGAPNDVACWLIHPGRSFRGFPENPKKLFLRSQSGELRCTIFVTPR